MTAVIMWEGSCLTDVFEYWEYIGASPDKYVVEDIIYQDFREAFDSVPQGEDELQSETKAV